MDLRLTITSVKLFSHQVSVQMVMKCFITARWYGKFSPVIDGVFIYQTIAKNCNICWFYCTPFSYNELEY